MVLIIDASAAYPVRAHFFLKNSIVTHSKISVF